MTEPIQRKSRYWKYVIVLSLLILAVSIGYVLSHPSTPEQIVKGIVMQNSKPQTEISFGTDGTHYYLWTVVNISIAQIPVNATFLIHGEAFYAKGSVVNIQNTGDQLFLQGTAFKSEMVYAW